MDELDVRTTVHLDRSEVYRFLADFERYARYSEYLQDVESVGDDEYVLRFGWWKVTYEVRSRVTEADQPRRIAFELTRGIRADGEWRLEADGEGTSVRFLVRYDPDTVASDAVDLPALVSIPWVIGRVEPFVEREARRVVERVVADLEGERREIDLDVSTDGGR